MLRYAMMGVLLWGAGAIASGDARANDLSLLSNGEFLLDADGDQWPDAWPRPEGATWEREGDVRFLSLRCSQPGQMILVYRRVDLSKPLPAALEIRLRLRHTDVKPGAQPWFDARIMGHFKDGADRVLKPEPPTPYFRNSSQGWIDRVYLAKVPAGAAYFEIMPCLFQPAAGTLDLARCEIVAATAEQWAATQPKVVWSEPSVVRPQPSWPRPLHVVGNRLETSDGETVWLQGLCVDSLQWSVAGEHLQQSLPVAIEQWKANVIRLPMTEEFWFGRAKGQKDGGLAYRKTVDAVIEAAASRGAYVALDLHRFGAPLPEHADFWKDAATRYKDHPAVLFELFNEPHGISWKLWRDGGSLAAPDSQRKDANPAENAAESPGEISPGMQGLVDAVRRAGAKNVVIAGGLDWGYDLSGVADGYALQERTGGNGIVYSSHIYPWKSDWQRNTLQAAAKYPVFVGEVGCPESYQGFEFIPPAGRHPLEGWPQDMLATIQRHQLNWTAFSFHPTCGPSVISDWNYTPTPYWGAYVKEALSGKQFEQQKMR